jgi:hypothetical protein
MEAGVAHLEIDQAVLLPEQGGGARDRAPRGPSASARGLARARHNLRWADIRPTSPKIPADIAPTLGRHGREMCPVCGDFSMSAECRRRCRLSRHFAAPRELSACRRGLGGRFHGLPRLKVASGLAGQIMVRPSGAGRTRTRIKPLA